MYEKTEWVNDETPLNSSNLNKIENELELLDDLMGSTAKGFRLIVASVASGKTMKAILVNGDIDFIDSPESIDNVRAFYPESGDITITSGFAIKGTLYTSDSTNKPVFVPFTDVACVLLN